MSYMPTIDHDVTAAQEQAERARVEGTGHMVAYLKPSSGDRWMRQLNQLFDEDHQNRMEEVAGKLLVMTHASYAAVYNKSQIVLVWDNADDASRIWMGKKVQSTASVLASAAAANLMLAAVNDDCLSIVESAPCFQASVFHLETDDELIDYMRYREMSAACTAALRAVQTILPEGEKPYDSARENRNRAIEEGVDFYDLPIAFRRASYAYREVKQVVVNGQPRNQSRAVFRNLPNVGQVQNLLDVLVDNEEPIVEQVYAGQYE